MEPMTSVPMITLPLSSLVQVTFLVTLLIVVIFAVILFYHWEQYAIDKRVKTMTYLAFSFVIVPLIMVMGMLSFIL